MTTLILVRHGQSLANLEKIYAGHSDFDLSPTGYQQAEKTAEYIVANYEIDKIYASDLKRAYNTAKKVADKLNMEIITDTNLREIFAGEWEGTPFDVLVDKYKDNYNTWLNDVGNSICTGGESVRDLAERISKTLTQIALDNDGKTVLVAFHATPIRAMQCLWSGKTLDQMKDVPWVSNASVTVAEFDGEKFDLKLIGEDSHLSDIKTQLPSNC